MDEVVRAMTDAAPPTTQITIANRQIVLADRMLRYVTQILQGGAARPPPPTASRARTRCSATCSTG
jgi:hypothetical protein